VQQVHLDQKEQQAQQVLLVQLVQQGNLVLQDWVHLDQ